ncbi:MAG: hypothetical protein CMG35_04750 [Candidatus Marinimicrobia bacterium]|nr:hypothetical protein [Candidatus Neomarinimicrobiota bacterium]|tara:strand:- start:63429 stop:64310 length:882 start_codon:yes stop_codon:yes gene_type:complete
MVQTFPISALTHNNYFTTSGHGSRWKVKLKSGDRFPDNYYKESIRAARLLDSSIDAPLVLLFSGGLDSEYMVNVFIKSGVEFKVAIISYGDYNKHDNKYAFEFCKKRNIEPIVIDVDIEKFITSGRIIEIANEAKCCAYQIPSIMEGILKVDGAVIMANGEPYVKNFDGDWRWEETERVNSYMNWYKQKNILGTPDFLRYTPQMTAGFLLEPRVMKLVNNELPGKLSTRTSKHIIYSQNFDLAKRSKFTGWEKLEQTDFMNNEVFREFDLLKKKYDGVFEMQYQALLDILLPT